MIYSEVLATGGVVPERVVTNDFFSYLVEDADNWIFSRTGIRERRFAEESQSTSDLATIAANRALANGAIDPAELDCIIVGTYTADNFIRSGKYKKILVIGADTYSKILDFQDQTTCPLFGDGAGAVILGATSEKKGILQTLVRSDGNGWDLIQVPSSGSRKPITADSIALRENTFKMTGKSVYVFATDVIPRIIETVTAGAGVQPEALDFIIPHQANVR